MELNSIRTNKHISVASSPGGRATMGDIMNTRCQSWMMDVAWEQNTGSHKLCPIGHWSQWTALTWGWLGAGQILAELMGTLARHPDIQEAGNFFSDCLASLHSPCKWATLFLTLKCWRASIPSDWHPLLAHLGCCLWGQRIHLGWTYISLYHEQNKWVLSNIFGKNAAGLFLINYDTEISQIVISVRGWKCLFIINHGQLKW